MKINISQILCIHSFSFYMLLLGTGVANGQCNSSQLQSSAYFSGNCGNLIFQGVIGSTSTGFGTCGDLYFSPPISGSDVNTKVEPIQYEAVVIRPNPAVDRLEILHDERQVLKNIIIFNSTGQISLHLESQYLNNLVDIQSIVPGIYYIQLWFHDSKPVTRKFVKIN